MDDRRSWLWRRKSSEKSPGETESSGSMSSHSERFSDDQVHPSQNTSSPEAMCKAEPNEEEVGDVKTLTEKLSAALLNLRAKEDLVKQHAKVAEEAVSGWEKAENEMLILKQQFDTAKQKNSVLEERVGHLDRALKECMRQLRQAKEVQEQKIREAVANNSNEVVELKAQLHKRLEEVEKENSSLKNELQSRLEELEFRTIERDLSTQAAETASKQHLESIKKVAKLEAECRKLKSVAHKTFFSNENRSLTFSDSMSDSGERLLEMNQSEPSKHMALSTEINLMDDFLEMERLASLPGTENVTSFPVVEHSTMKAEVEALVQKNSELEEELEKMEADKLELEMDLTECQKQLEASQTRIKEAELEVAELQTQLALARKSNVEACEELKATQEKNEIVESKLRVAQTEAEELVSKICSLERDIQKEKALSAENLAKEKALSAENLAKCGKLEDEILRMKHVAKLQKDTEILHRESVNNDLKQEEELALAASKFAECRKTIESLGQQLKSLATLEDFLLDSENHVELSNCNVTQGPQNGLEQFKLLNSDLSLPKRYSESPVSLNPSITHEKNRNSFGRFYPRSKSVTKTRRH